MLAAFRELNAFQGQEQLQEGIGQMRALQERVSREAEAVAEELQRWETKPGSSDTEQAPREEKAKRMLRSRLDELRGDILKLSQEIDLAGQSVDESRREEDWERVQRLARRQSVQVGDVFVIQTQVRAYLIELEPIGWERDQAVSHALTNRLDLMNRQAQVVDAWRQIRVAAEHPGSRSGRRRRGGHPHESGQGESRGVFVQRQPLPRRSAFRRAAKPQTGKHDLPCGIGGLSTAPTDHSAVATEWSKPFGWMCGSWKPIA